MNSQDYLNQIAADTRALKVQKTPFKLSPVALKLIIGAVILSVVIIVFGLIFGGKKITTNEELITVTKLNTRSEGIVKSLRDYNRKVKSSELRSMGSSLSAVITELNSNTSGMIKNAYNPKDLSKDDKATITEEENSILSEFNTNLENARLNGQLDRVYIRELTYQIALILNLETEVINKTKNDQVKSWFETNRGTLAQIYEQFDTYTDSTN